MSLLLNIDTAVENAIISIAKNGEILEEAVNREQKDHGAFLQPAIQSISKKTGIRLSELDAIAVVAGPGSYTGLRVGMATAKGLCYALNKPLITIGSLKVLAWQAIQQLPVGQNDFPTLYCPMIDARRMEVFTAVYDRLLTTVLEPCALIIEKNIFANQLLKSKVVFLGNGAAKWQQLCDHENAEFFEAQTNALYMSELSYNKYLQKSFADIAYAQPMYVKEFYNNPA
jgi:tRNA threonylcarbamoyladenosine biosynthesis protein TsaB